MTESKNKQKIKAYDDMIMLEQHTEDNLEKQSKKKKHGRTVSSYNIPVVQSTSTSSHTT